MNWGALAPALGTIGGAGLATALAAPTGGLSLAALPAMLPAIGTGAALGGAAGSIGGQLAPKDMPPPMGAPPGQKQAFMPSSMPQQPQGMQGLEGMLQPGQKGLFRRPFGR